MHWANVFLLLSGLCCRCLRGQGNSGLRELLQLQQNQELITHLGTRYEIVHPVQVGQDWGQGLSTRITTDGTVTHLQQTSLLIETFEHKLYLDLELNTNLFPTTLVQLVYEKNVPPSVITKLPENCHYHAKIRDHPRASAAFHTCNGIRGILFLEKKILLLHPLRGNNSDSLPHLLYHFSTEDQLNCGNTDELRNTMENILHSAPDKNAGLRRKFVEMALVIDASLFEKFKSPPSDAIASTIEMINYADLLFRPVNTSLSVVFVELWKENQINLNQNLNESLRDFKEYSSRRIQRLSIDAAYLLTGLEFNTSQRGMATVDSICTANAVGLTKVSDVFQPHITSDVLAHLIGHNLGMEHDSGDCAIDAGYIMTNNVPYLSSTSFSECSVLDYFKTLEKGFGACLFNMPTMRTSVCGNSILEEPEECDCGSLEECARHNPCCDPASCRLIKHAECSSGACCKKCKLLSSDHLCRASKGECDIAEFCDGKDGQCPDDIYKRSGAICAGGLGYCFQGMCPLLETQCEGIWGSDSDHAHSACFERLNVLGTPNGNCGTNGRGELLKCSIEDSYCGSLQCSGGEKMPIMSDTLPIDFVVYKMNAHDAIHECKALTSSSANVRSSLVQDGTKCGYQKLCLNQTCISIKRIATGKCPLEEVQATCSGHGVCTNINTCACHEGWRGEDCSLEDEDGPWAKGDPEYYDSVEREKPQYVENELQMNPNLAVTVLAVSILLGLCLVVILVIFIFYRHSWTLKSSSRCRVERRNSFS